MRFYKGVRIAVTLASLSPCRCPFGVKNLQIGLAKDQPVIIEVPPSQWSVKETAWGSGTPISILRADKDFISAKKWEDGTLPLLSAFHLEKAQDYGSGVMSGRIVGCPPNWKQLELRSTKAWLKLQFPPEIIDIDAALKQLAFMGSVAEFEATSYLYDKVFMPNQAKLFEYLPLLSQEDRYTFFKLSITTGFDVASVRFRELGYLQIFVPAGTTYNTSKVTQDERISRVLREVVLPEAKRLLPYADGKPIGGLSFHCTIPAYNFVTGGESKFDDLIVYTTIEQLTRFTSNDITSQKLIENSFVLLNGDRVEAKP